MEIRGEETTEIVSIVEVTGINEPEEEVWKNKADESKQETELIIAEKPKKAFSSPTYEYDIAGIDWIEYMNYFCFLSNAAKGYQKDMANRHSEVDKEICDLLHYIELYDLTEDESLKAVAMLKDARQRRRDIKDEISRAELFQKSIGTSANVAKAKGCIKELGKLETRKYFPRELSELFNGMSNRMTERHAFNQIDRDDVEINIEENETYEQEGSQMEYKKEETVFDGKQNNWLEMIQSQQLFFSNVQQYVINIELELDAINEAIEDTLNRIENANYNVTQGYRVFKELKDLRNEKKEKEKEWRTLTTIIDCFDCRAMSDTYRYLQETLAEKADNVQENNSENVAV